MRVGGASDEARRLLTARRRGEQQGAVAVEFALILVPFLMLVFGLIQYGFYFYSAQSGSHAINAAVRQLSVGNCQAQSDLQTYVTKTIGGAASGPVTVGTPVYANIDGSAPASPGAKNVTIGGTVTLTVTFRTINMHFPFVPFLSNAAVIRTATARVEDNEDQGCGS